ncbi:MAG TPA: alpha/beta hydrolase [Gaiellaceae bacterium]|nr:alpha/beta hydrolase [Gaiellaceae bacterium]
MPDRPGFFPNPPLARIDFDVDAAWLPGVVAPGDHLVAHSYGGIGALLAARLLPLASLTLIEPPAFRVAWDDPAVQAWVGRAGELPRNDTRTFVDAFLRHVGAPMQLPDELPPDLAQGAEAFMRERWPVEAEFELAPLPYPVLVVTGDHEPAFEAVGDALLRGLDAERTVLPGAGHAVQFAPGFNEALVAFVESPRARRQA